MVVDGFWIGGAHAFEFSPEDFGSRYDAAAGPARLDLHVTSRACVEDSGYRCIYATAIGPKIAVFGPPSGKAVRVAVQISDDVPWSVFAEAQRIAYGLCSPDAGEERRAASADALLASYDGDKAALPHVHVVLDGVRYSLVRPDDRSGPAFMAETRGTWASAAYPHTSPVTGSDYPPR